mgnify:CR=1 FL=1
MVTDSSLAPVALFTYRRPTHTQKVLEALASNSLAGESELFIFCDGAKGSEDYELVQRSRSIAKSRQWCKKIHIIEHATNLGLANSVIAGVTELCEKFGRVIVLEDDLVTSRYFLEYMNYALDAYADIDRVMQISGHMFSVNLSSIETDTFFLPFVTSWGWATWNRAWKSFDSRSENSSLIMMNSNIKHQFDLNGSYSYSNMLKAQLENKIDSWAIRWYLSVFVSNGLVLYPKDTFVENVGFDGSGTHCGESSNTTSLLSQKSISHFLPDVKVNEEVFDTLKSHLNQSNNRKLTDRLKSKLVKIKRRK